MSRHRTEVAENDQWNVSALYPSYEAWKKEFEASYPEERKPRWPELAKFQGKLGKDPQTLKQALVCHLENYRKIEKLYSYAHLRHDEDITHDEYKTAFQKILGIVHDFTQESSWLEPELLALPQTTIDQVLKSQDLKDYHFHLEKILRVKEHTLSPENEMIMALAGRALQAAHKAFSAINDADFKFGKVKDSSGEDKEMTHGTFGLFIRSQDRILRENAFKQYHHKFLSYENTLCELLQGQVQNHLFNARARKYSSCLQAALYPKNIDLSVYHSLITAVNENLDALHEYVALRKNVLGVKELHLYDMYVPVTKDIDITMPYEEAEHVIVEASAPLGKEYQDILRKGLQEERWVDRYENKNKRSGAYSSGCYDSMPYILMNYKELLRDVFTLSHEAGHSMHSYLSRKTQPYQYGDYPIFLAEVASTFNEDLLTRYLLEHSKNPQEKIFLVNQKIEDIRTTLFRQTMFAEFELIIHQFAENNIPLTPALLKAEYQKLNAKYFGNDAVIDQEIEIEWARIPHFYYNFYVYQYATGISAALALSDKVVNGSTQDQKNYLTFLKSGCRQYPIDLLKIAGVDMTTPEPVKQAISKFRGLVKELKKLLNA
jgi:oligoendopeptidase F